MRRRYRAVLCDLFGTLVDGRGNASEDAATLLESLDGGRWAIVTSCGAEFAKALLERAKLPLPDVLVSADDVVQPKPSPAGYLRAAASVGVPPTQCLVIEDSSAGVRAGKAAGMDVIAVGGRSADADCTIRSLGALRVATKANGDIVLEKP